MLYSWNIRYNFLQIIYRFNVNTIKIVSESLSQEFRGYFFYHYMDMRRTNISKKILIISIFQKIFAISCYNCYVYICGIFVRTSKQNMITKALLGLCPVGLVFLFFMTKSHLRVNTYYICLSGSGYFSQYILSRSIHLSANSRMPLFFTTV